MLHAAPPSPNIWNSAPDYTVYKQRLLKKAITINITFQQIHVIHLQSGNWEEDVLPKGIFQSSTFGGLSPALEIYFYTNITLSKINK